MIKAVITDFDGVIRHWLNDHTQQLEAQCKLAAGTLTSMCFSPERLLPAITGKISFEQWQAQVQDDMLKKYGLGIAEHFVAAWQDNGFVIDHELLAAYDEYFPNVPLVLATNATTRLPLELQDAGLSDHFQHVFNSSAMGVAKPQKEYFYAMLMSLGITAKQVLFIDDSLNNIKTAQALGMQALHYKDKSQLIGQLESISLQASLVEF